MLEIKDFKGKVLKTVDAAHLRGADLRGAYLTGAYLRGADLRGAHLRGADLRGADLCGADLTGAYLCGANLSGANLRDASLSGADLSGANLRDAYLRSAYLRSANLRSANLCGANLCGASLSGASLHAADLRDASLSGADLPSFSIIPEEGAFIGWKKLKDEGIAKLEIPAEAKRTSTLIGRKNRAEFVRVLELFGADQGVSLHNDSIVYRVGEIVKPDSYDDDIRLECTNGIHFFITRKEAEEYR